MKKLTSIIITTLAIVLFTNSLSYAAPTETSTPGPKTIATQLSPEVTIQDITELKTAGIPYETVSDNDGVKTTFHFDQGFSFTFVEPRPSISTFLWGGWDGGGVYILLTRSDIMQ